jgi:predicted DCC family thiol-disulfide oxidoreductase YuxK
MEQEALAPGVRPEDRIVLFDAVCRLCSFWAKFLIRFDKRRVFKLCSVQSDEGSAILAFYGMPTDTFETMALVEGPRLYTKSTAFFHIARRLPFPFPAVLVFAILPRVLRDWLYDRVARNRYKLFGRSDSCMMPTPDHESRFLRRAGL